jgi:hypothetical protein
MEEKLSDTREQMIRIEGVVNAIHSEVIEIKEDQKDLKKHVNDENHKMDCRIKTLEEKSLKLEVSWATIAKIIGSALTVIGVLKTLGAF